MNNPIEILELKSLSAAFHEIKKTGADIEGVKIMAPKAVHRAIRIKGLSMPASQILKEEMLSLGSDGARSRGSLIYSDETTDMILFATVKQYKRLLKKLAVQPFGLKALGKRIDKALRNYEATPPSLILPSGKTLDFGERTLIMGIINMSPDSFSGDGMELDVKEAVRKARQLEADGADIIDIGGESTRPGSDPVAVEDEITRTAPIIKAIAGEVTIPISIDTYKRKVAEAAIKSGAEIINDITGFHHDSQMAELAAGTGVGVMLMHIKGTPKDMQDNPSYDSLMSEIISYLEEGIEIGASNGVQEDKMIVDPGIGFGKTIEHNFQILNNLASLKALGRPILIGTSRKAFIGKTLDRAPEDRLYGTAATVAAAILNGAHIVRVHDVKQICDVVKVADKIRTSNE